MSINNRDKAVGVKKKSHNDNSSLANFWQKSSDLYVKLSGSVGQDCTMLKDHKLSKNLLLTSLSMHLGALTVLYIKILDYLKGIAAILLICIKYVIWKFFSCVNEADRIL